MARVLILGAGIAGHTAALFARQKLGKKHQVTVVTPNSKWNWIPSNIWVGVGQMTPEQVTFDLAPVYKKVGIEFIQAKALSIHPDGDQELKTGFVTVERTDEAQKGQTEKVGYDFLINSTGPRLNFAATEGLGPDIGHSLSVCTAGHAAQAAEAFANLTVEMKQGQRKRILIGTGHGMSTCQGAAFEYLFNLDFELRKLGLRDMADLHYITNEANLGDFGVGGMHIKRGGYMTHSKVFTESLFAESGISWITGAGVNKVESGKAHYETLEGEFKEQGFDFAMLIPPFAGAGFKAFDRAGEEITEQLFAPNGFMKVDADYTPRPFEEWSASDWPKTYQNPKWSNIFAAGIAFAPPHLISRPRTSPGGTPINPTPPRTGMPSAIIGKAVALSVVDMIKGAPKPTHHASMSEIGAACVASAGKSLTRGKAASMTMYPVVPDFERFPETGRDMDHSFGEIGLAGHWIKHLLHHLFLYKAKAKPFWFLIPE
ncbi:MAG: FAD/NAD(P)-binding oxidoreductase [bacterium]|nr:FAD/NAD(P)-binding oxidoreductase [bacterium]